MIISFPKLKKIFFLMITFCVINCANGQTCAEIMRYVKSTGYGTTYSSFNSDAISKVTFYQVSIDYQSYYYAIVCFKGEYYGCTEYIYQVGPNTKLNYSMNYLSSAGKAFWQYIQPYSKVLGCAPKLE